MAVANHFVNPTESYKRDYRFYQNYLHQTALYIQRMNNIPFEEALAFVKKTTAHDGAFPKKDPRVLVLSRHTEGNREKEEITFDEMMEDVVDNRRITSPSLAIYFHPSEKKSILAIYISANVKKRGVAKKAMFKAEREGNKVLQAIKEGEQQSFKIKNNSLSGAHNSKFTVLWLRSAHSTLTSTCRSAAAYANANNEKMLWGNRHYYSPNVVIENALSILALTDFTTLEDAVRLFNLYLPTAEECLECVTYSSRFYWHSDKAIEQIYAFFSKCSPLERAAFLYIGDIHHLAKYNPDVVRNLISEMIAIEEVVHSDPEPVLKEMTSDMHAFIGSLTAHLREYDEKGKLVDMDGRTKGIVATNIEKTYRVLDKYAPIIRGLWTTKNMPCSVAMFTHATRRAGVVSDTDSTIFTVQNWCHWYTGYNRVDQTTNAVRNTMVYFASQSIIHILAMMSANMGVAQDQLHQLAMKNEFAFPVFGLTPLAKHYYSIITECEGNVYTKPKLEIKGVSLRNSKVPKEITKKAREFIERILMTIAKEGMIEIVPILKEMAAIERQIITDVRAGSSKYLTAAMIKAREAYSKEATTTPYTQYEMWEEVFAPKYGSTPPPPYAAIKVTVDADKPATLLAWMARMEDQALAGRLKNYLAANGRKGISTFLVPVTCAQLKGIPTELVEGMDIRELVYGITSVFYLILEPLNIFMRNDHKTRLLSDYY